MTFSIVAWDRETADLGVAVASKYLAVGAAVPWVEAGVGAVATQSFVNASYGPDGLDLLRRGEEPITVAQILTAKDNERDVRQLGIVDAQGRAVTFTGVGCLDWAGGMIGDGVAMQGNLLAGPGVIAAMERAWLDNARQPLADRLLVALLAGDRAGGDRRGRQSAAILVKRVGAGYGGATDQLVDLRVDDHFDPVPELQRLFEIQQLLFGSTPEAEWVLIDDELGGRIRAALRNNAIKVAEGGAWDDALDQALRRWIVDQNLDERWWGGNRIDPVVVGQLLG